MKKYYKLLFCFVFFLLFSNSFSADVWAGTIVKTIELTEEERYDPKYYQPLDTGSRSNRTHNASAGRTNLEDEIINGLRERREKIEVGDYQLKGNDIFTYYYQILNNYPEFFYVASRLSYMQSNDGVVIAILPSYAMDEQETKKIKGEMDAAATKATALITDDMEDYEKALIVHDWLAVYCEYDYERYLTNSIPNVSHTAYGALVEKLAVCDGYSKAFQYIMQNKLGIPCYLTSSSTINHAWNIILIDGQYYHIDVTWDDPVRDQIGRVGHDNFLRSDAGITETKHTGWDSTLKAEDDSYKDALWAQSSGSIIYHDGFWYYVDENAFKLYKTNDILKGSKETLYTFGRWSSGGSSYYTKAFSYPQIYRNKLIFNDAKQIYSMPFSTEQVASLYIPEGTEEDTNCIYGFKLDGTTMYYAIQSTPNSTGSQSSFIKSAELPGSRLHGTVEINGELRYGNTLTATVALDGISDGVSYFWYRDEDLAVGRNTNTYELTGEDIGKTISVEVVHEDYLGELKKEAGVIQKAIPDRPAETLSVKGIYGGTLADIMLPDGYVWQNPQTVLSSLGQNAYPVTYCPDSQLYESFDDIEAMVLVECGSHTWNEGEQAKAASCTEKGSMIYTCIICGETKTEDIEATGHQNTEVKDYKEATCIAAGYTGDVYCKDCGQKIETGTEIESNDAHIWDAGKITKEPTDTETGIMTYTCTVCHAIRTEELPSLGNEGGNTQDSEKTDDTETKDDRKPSDADSEDVPVMNVPEKGIQLSCGKMIYKVTKKGPKNGTVEFVKTTSVSKTITIPATVIVDGITYKVTSIAPKALKGKKKVTKVVIGANVTKIGKEAFSGCKNLKNITIKSVKIKTVGANAIKNIHKKAKIYCPKKRKNAYKKLFTAKTGYKKTMSIK